jgi:carboxyl-terminal processing protease
VAKYESPSGNKIQDNAVTPNVAVTPTADDDDEDASPSKVDDVLTKALNLLKAKAA